MFVGQTDDIIVTSEAKWLGANSLKLKFINVKKAHFFQQWGKYDEQGLKDISKLSRDLQIARIVILTLMK